MKGKRHTPEQIVRKLREAERLQAEGADVDAVCRHLEISVQTFQRWRAQYKSMRPEDVARLPQRASARRATATPGAGAVIGIRTAVEYLSASRR